MELIKLEKVSKIYGQGEKEVKALREGNLTINKGELIAIMGVSGSGKTTLLNVLGCLDNLTEGKYYLEGNDIGVLEDKELSALRNKMFGFVVQDFALINEYSVYQNMRIPLDYSDVSMKGKEKKEKVRVIADSLGIEDKLNRKPTELSGGQKQRVAIGRAIINSPEVILADEPTGALDSMTGNEIFSILKELNDGGKTIIIVTHDLNLAKKCQRIINIEDGIING